MALEKEKKEHTETGQKLNCKKTTKTEKKSETDVYFCNLVALDCCLEKLET